MQVSILNIFNERQPHQRKVNEERCINDFDTKRRGLNKRN
jgi:hypothetical protein